MTTLRVERQDLFLLCEHASRAKCRADGPDGCGEYWHQVPAWHVWDDDLNDYAIGTGPAQFSRKRDAVAWVDQRTETAP